MPHDDQAEKPDDGFMPQRSIGGPKHSKEGFKNGARAVVTIHSMKKFPAIFAIALLLWAGGAAAQSDPTAAPERWTAARAEAWYGALPWLVGCNFIPSTAVNQLEMWQAETFDPGDD